MHVNKPLQFSLLCASLISSSIATGAALASQPALHSNHACSLPQAQYQQLIQAAQQHLTDTPQAIAKLHTEGTLPHQGIRDQSQQAEKDLPLMRNAALAYRASGDKRYLDQVNTYLTAWTSLYQPSFNPIDETGFSDLISAYQLTQHDLPLRTAQKTADFIRSMTQGYIKSIDQHVKPQRKTWINNWQSHRIKLVTQSAVALQDGELFAKARQYFYYQLDHNIRKDGSTIDFEERDALHYVTYDLQPLIEAAIAAKSNGENWFTDTGRNDISLKKAVNWLVPYAQGKEHHTEFANSKVPFDAARRKAGVAAEQIAPWLPATSSNLFWLASQLDKSYLPLAQKLKAQQDFTTLQCPPSG
jgi:hypothetical protein